MSLVSFSTNLDIVHLNLDTNPKMELIHAFTFAEIVLKNRESQRSFILPSTAIMMEEINL